MNYKNEELKIVDYIEKSNHKGIPMVKQEIEKYQYLFKKHATKRKLISARLLAA